MEGQQLKLRYRKRPFVTLLMLLMVVLFLFALFILDFDRNKGMYMIFILSISFLLFGLLSQLVLWRKEYHFFVDKKERKLFIDNGLRKNKEVDLDDILGIAYDSVTVKSTTTYTLQLKVKPNVWGTYYKKKPSNITQVEKDYIYMFISVGIVNQNDADVQQLITYLSGCGLELTEFQKTILGKTNGIMKKHSIDTTSKEYKKLVYKQVLSYFFKWLFVLFFIFYFLLQLLGRFNGIYW